MKRGEICLAFFMFGFGYNDVHSGAKKDGHG